MVMKTNSLNQDEKNLLLAKLERNEAKVWESLKIINSNLHMYPVAPAKKDEEKGLFLIEIF